VRRTDGSGRVLPLFGYYIILNFFKGPILVFLRLFIDFDLAFFDSLANLIPLTQGIMSHC